MKRVGHQLPIRAKVARLLSSVAPRLDGADISHYQDEAGPLDWPVIRASTWWIGIKATQGTGYVDPTFAGHRVQASLQQFPIRLLYHWLDPSTSPTAQAIHFLLTVGKLAPGEGVMLDVEEPGVTAAMVLEWCSQVERITGRPVVIYTGAYTAGGTIWQSTQIRRSPFGPRAMHLAAYTTEARALALPGVAVYPWSGWQYSSNGPVPGIPGRCDMNRIDVREHYELACGVTALPPPAPAPTEEPPMMIRMLSPVDSPARFLAECTAPPVVSAIECRWTGPGDDPKVVAKIAAHRNAHQARHPDIPFELPCTMADLINVALEGECPSVCQPEQFANTDQIRQRQLGVQDMVARQQVADVQSKFASLVDRLKAAVVG